MEKVRISEKEYTLIKDFKDDQRLRKSYNELTHKTYGFDFEDWYQNGYWGDNYIPHALLDGHNIVANVSVSITYFQVLGVRKRFIQIGTVMTDDTYRNQGLSKCLMEMVIDEWKNKCDMIYLFANASVLDFYPKFGFTAANEYQYSKTIMSDREAIVAEKLDMSLANNRKLVEEKVSNSVSLHKLAMLNNMELIMFYCTSFLSNNVYYLRDEDVVVIADFIDDTLYLIDIFSLSEVDLERIIMSLTNKKIKAVVLGFTPIDVGDYSIKLMKEDDLTLFIMKDNLALFQENKLMFPPLSHA